MCRFKSAIILKDRVFVPDYDRHTDMLEELKIKDNQENAKRLFVRAELIPPKNDVFSDINTWNMNIDQDIIPEWFVAEYEKQRLVDAVKMWAKTHIYISVNNIELTGCTYYLKECQNVRCSNSTVEAWGNSTVEAYSNSTVEALDNSTVKAYDNSTVEAWDNSTVEAWDNSTVEAYSNSTVKAYDNSTVKAYDNSTVVKTLYSTFNTENLVICDNATFKDCSTKTIYQSGDYKLVSVTNGKINN